MLNIILPAAAVAPSSGTSSDLPVLEADAPPTEAAVAFHFLPPPKALGSRALCGGASSAWLPSVGNRLLSSSSSSEWPEAKLASSELSEFAGFPVAADPAFPLFQVASALVLTGERCRGSWPHYYLSLSCLWKAPPHFSFVFFSLPHPLQAVIHQIKGFRIE